MTLSGMNESSGWMRSWRLEGGFTEGQLFSAVFYGNNLREICIFFPESIEKRCFICIYTHIMNMHVFSFREELPLVIICAVFATLAELGVEFSFKSRHVVQVKYYFAIIEK